MKNGIEHIGYSQVVLPFKMQYLNKSIENKFKNAKFIVMDSTSLAIFLNKTLESIVPSDFKVGQIFKFKPTKYSHVKNPYYAEVVNINEHKGSITTNIPKEHSLEIDWFGSPGNSWYHLKRMEYVGMKKDYGHLLLNQNLD